MTTPGSSAGTTRQLLRTSRSISDPWDMRKIRAGAAAQAGITGRAVRVGIIDSDASPDGLCLRLTQQGSGHEFDASEGIGMLHFPKSPQWDIEPSERRPA